MDLLDLIYCKRAGGALSAAQLQYLVAGVVSQEVDREQLSALLMAIYLKGMQDEEISELTLQMATQGQYFERGSFGEGRIVDKHSTGGVGDKVSLVLIPMMAAAGVTVAKLSGRGLGHTGGTLDKLEVFPGFRTDLSIDEFRAQVKEHKLALSGQTDELVPADKILYALRDLTGTVESLPLIASSIMSKKIATGADAILLDVKVGSGATLGDEQEARQLARLMIKIGNKLGRKTQAFITNMQQPLGRTIGNQLEVQEAFETLAGNGPDDLTELCLELAATSIVLAEIESDLSKAKKMVRESLSSGLAQQKFIDLIELQWGDTALLHQDKWPEAPFQSSIIADRSGYLSRADARAIGEASMLAGAGRRTKKDQIDPLAGIVLAKKVGDQVSVGEKICTLYSSDEGKLATAAEKIQPAFQISESTVTPLPVILDHLA